MSRIARMSCPFLLSWTAACAGIEGDAAAAPSRVVELEFRTPYPSDLAWIARTVHEDPYLAQAARADVDGDGSLDTVVVAGGRRCSAAGCPTWVFLSGGANIDLGRTHLLDGASATVEYASRAGDPPRLVPRDAAGSAYVPDRGPQAGQAVSYAVVVPPSDAHAIVDIRFRDALPAEVERFSAVVDPGSARLRIASVDLDGDLVPDWVVVDASGRCDAAGCPTWVYFSSGLVTELGDTWLLAGESVAVVFGSVPHAPPMLAPRGSDGKAFVPKGHDEDDLVYYPVLPLGSMATRIVARDADDPAPD